VHRLSHASKETERWTVAKSADGAFGWGAKRWIGELCVFFGQAARSVVDQAASSVLVAAAVDFKVQ